jgi:hypothetical protein
MLNTKFTCEVIGASAKTRTGAKINFPVLQCYNTSSKEKIEYVADGYTYDDFMVEPLNYEE